MPRFAYTALDSGRRTTRGTVSAETAYAARKHLRTRGIHPTDIREITSQAASGSMLGLVRRTNRGQVTEFTKEMATMIGAGIKLTDSLGVLTQQISNPHLRAAVTEIRDRVVTGESMADAMSEYPQHFDIVYVSMVRVGELTGTLAETLKTMSIFREKQQKIETKMKTAMIYPSTLIIMAIVVILFLTMWLLPKVVSQFQETGQQLPAITQAVMAVSETLRSWKLLVIIAAIIALIWGYRKFVSTPKGAMLRDTFLLRLWVIGPLLKKRIIARFASTLSTLLSAGMSMAESLKVVAEVTGNRVMHQAIMQARDRILSGADIATPLRDSGVIEPSIAHMVTVGEKSGELEMMLRNISENLEASSDVVVERLVAAVEPLIIIGMAVVVGLIALAAILPIVQLSVGQF